MVPTPTLRQMRGLVTVARLGSFSRAASELGMSQSALSQAIQQLEFLLDVPLLERKYRSVTVTPAGEKLVFRLERILRDINDAVESARHEAKDDFGSVSVACLSTVATLLMPAAVRRFKTDYPKVAISIRDENVDGILDQVKAGDVDFAVTCLFRDDRDIAFEPVIRDRFRFVCHKDHPYSERRSVRWQDLEEISLVTVAKGSGVRRMIDKALPGGNVLDRTTYEVSRVPSVLQIVEEGDVSSVLPALTLAAVKGRSPLTHCPVTDPVIEREVGVLTQRGQALPTLAEKFREYFIETLCEESVRNPMVDVTVLAGRGRKPEAAE